MEELNIAHIDTHTYWRGGQRQVIELIKGLNKLHLKNVLFCRSDSKVSERAQEVGIKVIHIPLAGEWDIYSAIKIRSYIVRERINIVHAHSSHAHTLGLMALVKNDTCKLVVSRRVDFHINNIISKKFKYGPSVDKIITVSDAIRRILIEDGIDQERLVTIRSGFVEEEFERGYSSSLRCNEVNKNLRSELGLSDDNVVIATVAALAPHKAHNVLLKAASLVVKKHPNVKFLLAGEGELKDTITKNIYNLGLENIVILLGYIKDIGSVYEAADIFALSSREEGLCTSILDAMYFGLPVVTTNAGGIPELVSDGINGLIVPVEDYELFAEKLNLLIENPDRRKKMGARSSDILEQNRMEKTIEKTLQVYKKLWESK